MRRRTKVLIGGGVGVLVLGSAAIALGGRGGDATGVRVEVVERRDLVGTVTGNGWIRPGRSVDVQADVMGRIVELRVKEGDQVERGQLLLRIDADQYEAAVARARAAVSEARAGEAQARASLLQAQRNRERAEALASSDANLISAQQVEEARAQAEVQEAVHEASTHRVQQAIAALREAENQLAKTVIRAPMDGVVTRLNVEEGETAIVGTMNNPGSLLLTVSDLSAVEAVVRVDETDVPRIHFGDSATIEIDAFPRRRFTGSVIEVAHSALQSPEQVARAGGQGQSVDYQVVIRMDQPPPELRPDFSATAEIVTAIREAALAVPIISLTVRDRAEPLEREDSEAQAAADRLAAAEEEGVFLLRDGEARFVPVTIGIAGREFFEVLDGVAEGDSVVAGPYQAIRELEDGRKLRVLGQETTPRRRGT